MHKKNLHVYIYIKIRLCRHFIFSQRSPQWSNKCCICIKCFKTPFINNVFFKIYSKKLASILIQDLSMFSLLPFFTLEFKQIRYFHYNEMSCLENISWFKLTVRTCTNVVYNYHADSFWNIFSKCKKNSCLKLKICFF